MSHTPLSHRLALFWLPLVLVALGCQSDHDERTSTADSDSNPVSSAISEPPSLAELANATYGGVLEEPVELTDGQWEGEPFVEGGASRPSVGLARDFLLHGDLDADGNEESVVVLWSSSGGSGTFDHLAAMGTEAGRVVNLGTAAIGDRVRIRSARIVDGRIELDVIQAGPEDAACCPTQMATRSWLLNETGLTEVASEVTGTMSLAELAGTRWVLTHWAWDEAVPDEPRVSLTFEPGRIAGESGCNAYFAEITDGEAPSSISLGAIGSTRKMCPDPLMQVEDRFLEQLAAVTQYTFITGKLGLTWETDEGQATMLFAETQAAGS